MKFKQINFLFKRLFKKPQAVISIKVYKDGTLLHTRGDRASIIMALIRLFENEKLRPDIAEAQIYLVKKKTGIDPRQIIEQAMRNTMEEHKRQHEMGLHSELPVKQKGKSVN